MSTQNVRSGSTLITCLIFIVVFSAMAVAMAGISGNNLQIADNQQNVNRALASAESGLEVVRHWLTHVTMPSSTPPSHYLSTIISAVQSDLATNNISNLILNNDGSIPSVIVDPATGQSFSGKLSVNGSNPSALDVRITGQSNGVARTLKVAFAIEAYRYPIFDYGMATKGTLTFPQNPTLTGANDSWEADVYVESANSLLAVQVGGNLNFDGQIDIGNPLANVDFQGAVQIAGDTGQTAIDNHVNIGADPVEFPVPETAIFQKYATGSIVDASTDLTKSMTLTNAVVRAGTNPTFLGNVIVQGILLIEAPNTIVFDRNVQLDGLIVAEGNAAAPGTNQISFRGNFASGPYPSDAQFDALRNAAGSCILAPGFSVSFTGNFSSVDGVLAASGIHFSANASATVKGTIISYSDDPTVVNGNIAMNFDRAGDTSIPAGFDLLRVLNYEPASYAAIF